MDLNGYSTTTLYFTAGAVPTQAELDEAKAISTTHATRIKLRNGEASVNGGLEHCDFVAGKAPVEYTKAFPQPGAGHETATEANEGSTNTETATGSQGGGQVPKSAPSSLASEVGSVRGGWGA